MFLKFTCMLHELKAFTSFHPMKTCRCFDVLIHYFFLPFFFLDFMILSLRALGNVICFLVSILFTLLLFLLLHRWSAFSRSVCSFTHWHSVSPQLVFKRILRYHTARFTNHRTIRSPQKYYRAFARYLHLLLIYLFAGFELLVCHSV